jgi:predicted dehydrogenase
LCNIEKRVEARVEMVWGETAELAQKAAADGQVPVIVKDWREMLGKVDGVMIDHRHPKYHFEPAKFFLSSGVPTFVDKPFTFTVAEGKKLIALARRKKTPVTSFSVIPLQQSFADFKAAVANIGEVYSLTTAGPADIQSEWGGVFFYGIHQVDAIIGLLGMGVSTAQLLRHGDNAIVFLTYKNGPMVTLTCVKKGLNDFHWSAAGEKGVVDWSHKSDANPYLNGLLTFVKMFATKQEPFEARRILAPIAVLEAMAKSLKTGKAVKVAKV